MNIEILKPSQLPESWRGRNLGLDIETESDAPFPQICTIQLYSPQDRKSVVIPVKAIWKGEMYELPQEEIEILKDFLGTIKAVGHNLQFDLSILLHNYGVEVLPKFDTFLMARVFQLEEQALKSIIRRLHPEIRNQLCDWSDLNLGESPWVYNLDNPKVLNYVGLDPYLPFILGTDFKERIIKHRPILDLETKYLRVAVRERASGLNVDEELYENALLQVKGEWDEKQTALNEMAGFPVRPHSAADLKEFLIRGMGVTPTQTTSKGEPSFSSDALTMMLDNESSSPERHRAVELVQECKSLKSVYSSLQKVPTYFV